MNITFIPLPEFDGYALCIFCKGRSNPKPVDLFSGVVCTSCAQDFASDIDGAKWSGVRAGARYHRIVENSKVSPVTIKY